PRPDPGSRAHRAAPSPPLRSRARTAYHASTRSKAVAGMGHTTSGGPPNLADRIASNRAYRYDTGPTPPSPASFGTVPAYIDCAILSSLERMAWDERA